MHKILFVVAHPDDEILGAGAFIYDRAVAGDEIGVLVLNSCDTTRYEGNRAKIVDDLKKSQSYVGVKRTWVGDFLDSNFHNADHRKMVKMIENVIRDFQPDIMFTQHPGDINTDHYWTAASAMEAFRLGQRGREDISPINALYLMEVQSSTDWALNPSIKKFEPNTFVEVSEKAVAAKFLALDTYENVIRPRPHPRSQEAIFSLPILRGGQAGFKYAEAFECVFRRESL
ncbi:MAG: PIG-L family deacetylase [Oscillospiraceae bacterium]|nr:PIG-L family deacetylase [Oscillospiraceae bacterium]